MSISVNNGARDIIYSLNVRIDVLYKRTIKREPKVPDRRALL